MIEIFNCDSLSYMKNLHDVSIDAIITDPPYGLTHLEGEFDTLEDTPSSGGVFAGKKGGGMSWSAGQNSDVRDFLLPFFEESYRVLKPGSFCVTFSQGRLLLGVLQALELSGFEIREQFYWRKPSALPNQQKPTKKNSKHSIDTSRVILGPGKVIEPFVVAQKPKEGTYAKNYSKWGVGLVDPIEATVTTWDFPSASKHEKNGISHVTVKPLPLMRKIVRAFTESGNTILDPFSGSGTTGIAALLENRNCIGLEISELFWKESKNRLQTFLEPERSDEYLFEQGSLNGKNRS